MDCRNPVIEFRGTVPRLEFFGQYKIAGKVLFLPVGGQGTCSIVLDQCQLALRFKVKLLTRGGRGYVVVDKAKLKIEPKR